VCIPSRAAEPHAVARATLPADYPSASPPVAELVAPHLPAGFAEAAAEQLEALFSPGERCDPAPACRGRPPARGAPRVWSRAFSPPALSVPILTSP
jgi:hypothetical protein